MTAEGRVGAPTCSIGKFNSEDNLVQGQTNNIYGSKCKIARLKKIMDGWEKANDKLFIKPLNLEKSSQP
jgi:hypothetical protein